MSKTNIPVSVIIPVYNDPDGLKRCLEAVLDQDYPLDEYEVIVVDNNSDDNTSEIARKYSVQLLFETKIQSSYAARNRGIKSARGEIIAFTDSDCIPHENWLKNGTNGIKEEEYDMVGGKISFLPMNPSERSVSEVYDSIMNLQMERSVQESNSALTANLFVKKSIFQDVGKFSNRYISGGDSEWTQRATNSGYNLGYAPGATVFHPVRGFKELIKKNTRIGRGRYQRSGPPSILGWIRGLFPPNVQTYRSHIKKAEERNDINIRAYELIAFYFLFWIFTSCRFIGRLQQHLKQENCILS